MNEMNVSLSQANHLAVEAQKQLTNVQEQLKVGYGLLIHYILSQKVATNNSSYAH